MRRIPLVLLLVSGLALAQAQTTGGGIQANCPSCVLVDSSLTLGVAAGSTAITLTNEGALIALNSGATSFIKGDPSIHGIDFQSNVTSGGGNNAYIFDTASALSGNGLFAFNNHGTIEFQCNSSGACTMADSLQLNGALQGFPQISASGGHATFKLFSHAFTTDNAWLMDTNNGAITGNLLQVGNNGTIKLTVTSAGDVIRASHITCAMSASTSCTATVPTGSACICGSTSATSSAASINCSVASTTATCNASASNSNTWNILVY